MNDGSIERDAVDPFAPLAGPGSVDGGEPVSSGPADPLIPPAGTSGPSVKPTAGEGAAELELRERYGYSSSERRDTAERQAVASRIRARLGLPEREHTRAEAIEFGRRLGQDEAGRRSETGLVMEERVKRSMAYAAWEYDGSPPESGALYRKEFGLTSKSLTHQSDRDPFRGLLSDPDGKPAKGKK